MHEMSLVLRIIDIATEKALLQGAQKISKIELLLGDLSGVMYESLMFSFEIAVKHTLLEDAEVIVKKVPGRGLCTHCNHAYLMNSLHDACPKCSALNPTVIQGREFQVVSIDVI